uniref:Glycerophosphodiester phosphodiesterase domain containing 4a n=1 Tax=Sander lucioperca TaxID=283035 RepID=A0A8C9ZFN0_SANLU
MNHPDRSGRLGELCFLSPESGLNTEKQRSVFMHHVSGTNSQKTAGPLQSSVLLNQVRLCCVVVCSSVRQVAVLGLYLSVLFSLYLVPLGMYSPCIKEAGTLGPAPTLIGHRGAPMLAPENTVMSFEKAVEAGGEGLETDVTISYDGVPFLMHDATLKRTTNVAEVFPNRTHLDASMFSWAELQQLNAGDWFLLRDPFGTVSSLSEADCSQAQNQSVPSLAQFLEVAASSGRLVLFDLHKPPYGHPYICGCVCLNSCACVLWLPSEDRDLVWAVDPELQQTSGEKASIQELTDSHITSNFHLSPPLSLCSKYQSVNISTNLYVISQQWLYTLAWCAGAQSVTTNSIHILSNINKPLFLMVSRLNSSHDHPAVLNKVHITFLKRLPTLAKNCSSLNGHLRFEPKQINPPPLKNANKMYSLVQKTNKLTNKKHGL